ncbi:MAG: hypothetical protein B6D61_06295 [Bacteroidetes bacterium 4484_249]|nr:MAG: hypothetical protein B6D61_06295 [Bacteroidetes bacterium 4484_249]
MKKTVLVLSFVVLVSMGFANFENESNNALVEKICEQGILSQKMVKDFMMMGIGFRIKETQMELDESVADYEISHLFFEEKDENDRKSESIDAAENSWMKFRLIITDKVTPENAYQLLKTNEALLNSNKRLLSLIGNLSELNLSKGYMLSKEMEMLSQRIAMLYFAHSWGVQKDVTLRYFSDAVMKFEANLDALIADKENNIQIKSKLLSLKNQWVAGKKLFGNMGFNRYYPDDVFELTSGLSNNLSIIVLLFQQQQEELADNDSLP